MEGIKLSTPKLFNDFKESGVVPFQEAPTYGTLIVKIILVF